MNHVSSLKATKVHGYMDIDIKFGLGANILYGVNGSGKSTVLRILASALTSGASINWMEFKNISVLLSDGRELLFERDEEEDIHHSIKGGKKQGGQKVILSTPFNRLYPSESLSKILGIFQDATPTSPKHIIEILLGYANGILKRLPPYEQFADEVRAVLQLDITNAQLLHQMSTGQKHALSMLYSAAFEQADILLVDEPESSLHIDTQDKLPSAIMNLMGQGQLIVATHSPEIYTGLEDRHCASATELLL